MDKVSSSLLLQNLQAIPSYCYLKLIRREKEITPPLFNTNKNSVSISGDQASAVNPVLWIKSDVEVRTVMSQ